MVKNLGNIIAFQARMRLFNYKLLFTALLLTNFVSMKNTWAQESCHSLFERLSTFQLSFSSLSQYRGITGKNQLKLDHARINNERDSFKFRTKEIKPGALLGLGGDNNLNMAVMSKHREVFIYDFDPRVIAFHRVIKLGFKLTHSSKDFINLFERWQHNKLTAQEFKTIQNDLYDTELFLKITELIINSELSTHFKMISTAKNQDGELFTYLGNQMNFNYIKEMYVNNHIHTYLGSHFNQALFQEISKDLNESGQKLTAIYFSNSLETRWIMDQQSPEARMILMMLGLYQLDRGSMNDKFKMLEDILLKLSNSNITDNEKKEFIDKYQSLSASLPLQAQMLTLSTGNWNSLAQSLSQFKMDPEAKILLTQIDPLETMGFTTNDFQILGLEKTQLDEKSLVEWTYSVIPAKKFISKMQNATAKKAQ